MDDAIVEYVRSVADRLKADGCEVTEEEWASGRVLVGYRSDFRLRWVASWLHLFTIVKTSTAVSQSDVEAFTGAAIDYAVARKGQFRGLQSAVAVLPCIVGAQIEPAALDWAQRKQRVRFAVVARPVLVDPINGTVKCYRGISAFGAAYTGHLRRKVDSYFPVTGTGTS